MANEALLSRDTLLAAVRRRYKSQAIISRYAQYLDRLQERELPAVLSFRHFADIVDLPASKLGAMSFATHHFYRTFEIPKKSGGLRAISAPLPDLAMVQRWLVESILKRLTTNPSAAVTAYTPGRSIIDHVSGHLASAQLLKLDLRDFFPSISTGRVYELFTAVGYSSAVARTFAALTTMNGNLPQGAPSSPLISNLVLEPFDTAVLSLCSTHDLHYTRYADDIVISGSELGNILEQVSSLASENGFEINHKKTKSYLRPEEPRFVTGLVLKDGRARLPKASRRRIRAQAHYYIKIIDRVLETDGSDLGVAVWPGHFADSFDDVLFPDRILGRLQFWSWIEAEASFPRAAMAQLREKLASL